MSDGVKVMTDPAEVAAARAAWRAWRAQRLTTLLEAPSTIPYAEGFEIPREDPDRARAALVRVRDDDSQPPQERLAAIHALTKLGVAPDAAQVAAIATLPNRHASWIFNVFFDALYPPGTPLPDDILRALATALADPDQTNQQIAEQAVARHRLTQFAPTLLANARKGKSFRSLATLHPTAEVLEFLIRGSREWNGMDAAHCSVGLIDFAEATRDETDRTRAIEAFHEYIRKVKSGDPSPITDVSLAAAVKPAALARRMITPITTLARDPQVREQARRQLAELAAAEATAPPTDPAIVATLVRLGVITQPEADRGGGNVPEHQKSPVFAAGVPAIEALARLGRYAFVERIAERVPYRHDYIINQLGALAAVPLKLEAVMETSRPLSPHPEDDSGVPAEYHVQFIHANRLYRFAPPDPGYQYNVPAVVDALNRALADAGVPDRFVALSWDSSAIEYLFAPPDALRAAAAELGFELNEAE